MKSLRIPAYVKAFNTITRPLLALGVPMGPNVLLTVRGRKSGLPRTTPVTIVEEAGRRWVFGVFGEGEWVRNLRVARRGTITARRRKEDVIAVEQGPEGAVEFFRDGLAPRYRRTAWLGRWIVRNLDKVDVEHPVEAAKGRPVFELFPVESQASDAG
jgi:deazaflavin-dependent oxidoreductase (nitroreductase family)